MVAVATKVSREGVSAVIPCEAGRIAAAAACTVTNGLTLARLRGSALRRAAPAAVASAAAARPSAVDNVGADGGRQATP